MQFHRTPFCHRTISFSLKICIVNIWLKKSNSGPYFIIFSGQNCVFFLIIECIVNICITLVSI